jgi:anti-anti-sigma factor
VRTDQLLRVDVADGPDGVRLLLIGELDAYTAWVLRGALVDELRRGDAGDIVLDCARLDFMDGGGLKVIEWAAVAADPRAIAVRNASPVMCQLAAITGLDRSVDFGAHTGRSRIAIAGR